jgi:type IV pilus assembly protein PilE
MRRHAGFTIIELMVAVAIIAILAAIGYPSYSDYTRRGKIAEALSTLAETRAKMEQYYLDNRAYTGANAAGLPCDTGVMDAGKKYFSFNCVVNPADYTVTATGRASEGMGAFTYTVNQQNVRSTTISGLSGWDGTFSCWVVKKGGVC